MQRTYAPNLLPILCLVSALGLLLVNLPEVAAQAPTAHSDSAAPQASSGSSSVFDDKGSTGPATYIIRLKDAPLASYRGGLAGLNATSPQATRAIKLNLRSAASVAYRGYLARQRSQTMRAIEQTIGHAATIVYDYDVALNGMAVRMTAAEAARVASLPGVASVRADTWRQPTTTVSPPFIGATQIWDGTATGGLPGTKGQGIIIGVIDTGIWPEHPSFADDHTYPAPPASWGGTCAAPADSTAPYTCTNKLIGVQFFLTGYTAAVGGTYDGRFKSGRDDNGHGTHTASIAAGNQGVDATLLGVPRGQISGIAPRAYVAVYKALGPRGGLTSDLAEAIDRAVADGVDVINYSIGGGALDPWDDEVALAFLAARDAGVFVAVSAGNSGPGTNTIGSPANAPWLTAVGASTSNRQYTSIITLTGSLSPTIQLYGTTVTTGVTSFRLRDAEGIRDIFGDTVDFCPMPYPPGTFQPTDVVLCLNVGFAEPLRMADNVKAGGAGGIIVYNLGQSLLRTDNFIIPQVHVQNDTGTRIKDYIRHNSVVTVTFSAGRETFAPDLNRGIVADQIATFSSRGPNDPALDIVKPDVAAPGVQVLAGASPQHDGPGARGQLFQSLQGTSMASPHVAGAAALLKALHPTWAPAEIQSALMSTAKTAGVLKEDSSTAADPFDRGSGRIDLTVAARAGFVLDETTAHYLGANPSFDGSPATINQASLGDSVCVISCSWTRRLRSTASVPVTWSVSSTAPTSMTLTATPSSFTLNAGATRVLTFTANVANMSIGDWAFAQVNFTPNITATVQAHFPLAVRPARSNLPDTVEINTLRSTGTYTLTGVRALAITDRTDSVYGLTEAELTYRSLRPDVDNGAYIISRTVPLDSKRFVAEIVASTTSPPLISVYQDNNGDGVLELGELVCSTAEGYCSLNDPAPVAYWIFVSSRDAQANAVTLATAIVPKSSSNNLRINGPNSVPGGAPFNLRLSWNTARMLPGSRWYGAFELGANAASSSNLGRVNIDLIGPRGTFLPILTKN
jgi:subtilisin family serine protease